MPFRGGQGGGGQAWQLPPNIVKSIALMRWLVRLITPPGATVLDLFAGSGTTLLATEIEGGGRRCLAVEQSAEYVETIRARFSGVPELRLLQSGQTVDEKTREAVAAQVDLFAQNDADADARKATS